MGSRGQVRSVPRFPGSACGPEGSFDNYPADFPPYFSINNACVAHDQCYERCNANRAECDNAFYEAMQTICQSIPPRSGGGFARVNCNRIALNYYWVVRYFGQSPFDRAQRTCVGCS